jgi:20S proteasome alpha/beta subunit
MSKLLTLACCLQSYALLAGRDEHNTCSLWRVDPTGQFWKCNAAAIGRGAHAAEAHLQELVSARTEEANDDFFSNLSCRQALSLACACIEKALPKENKLYWQALVLRTTSDIEGEQQQASSQVLDGNEIELLLTSDSDDKDSVDDKVQ